MNSSPRRIVVIVALTLAAVFAARRWAFEPIYVASGSMEPTLFVGQRLLADKLTFRFRAPRRGELVVFTSPADGEHGSIKRVIAVAGDTVELRAKTVYLNGEPQLETYVKHTRAGEILDGDNLGPLTVPEGSLFVLGDNRDNSDDSASWRDPATRERVPFLPLSAIQARVRGIY